MSTITVSGTVDYTDPIRTHDEPASPYVGGTISGGVTSQVSIPGFKNTGNVPQTVTVVISDSLGCTISGYNFESSGNQYERTVTLNPGFSALLRVNIQTPNTGPGDDTGYSFDVDTVWQ